MLATFQAWNMLPPVIVEISKVTQKTAPMVQATGLALPPTRSPRPRLITYIAPPCGLSGSLVSR